MKAETLRRIIKSPNVKDTPIVITDENGNFKKVSTVRVVSLPNEEKAILLS
jgi:hypothetical protein